MVRRPSESLINSRVSEGLCDKIVIVLRKDSKRDAKR